MSEQLQQIVDLLHSVQPIVERHQKINRAQGLDFNVFDVVRRTTDEVHGHSAMIGELLDPQGSHGQGDRLLRLFFNQLCLQPTAVEDELKRAVGNQEWKVTREKAFTLKSGPYAGKLGRIDIELEGTDVRLIIENKIDAEDQDAQLERYRQYGEEACPKKKPYLFYLTRSGSPPSDKSLSGMPEEARARVTLLSYGSLIGDWIEDCIQAAALLPHLRETLVQYHRLVIRLANGVLNKEMTMEIVRKIMQPDSFRAALEIEKAITEVKIKVQLDFWKALQKRLLEKLSLKPENLLPFFSFSKDLVRDYYVKARNIPREYGIGVPVMTLNTGWKIVFAVLVDCNIYCAFYLHDGEKVVLNPQEHCDCGIINAVLGLGAGQDGSDYALGGRWWCPEPKLLFRVFNDEYIQLMDGQGLAEMVERLSQELVDKVSKFRTAVQATRISD